jgi:transcriptional regulator with XRE-family HTH domain
MPRRPRPTEAPRPAAGARLLALRQAAGLTQAELARLIGERQNNVSFWEHASRTPRSDVLPRLAKALGTSVEALLGEPAKSAPIPPWADGAGHASRLRRAFDEVRRLPKRQQRKVLEFVTAFVNEHKRTAC